jgi:hypothetical protein
MFFPTNAGAIEEEYWASEWIEEKSEGLHLSGQKLRTAAQSRATSCSPKLPPPMNTPKHARDVSVMDTPW